MRQRIQCAVADLVSTADIDTLGLTVVVDGVFIMLMRGWMV